jgi:hypothetical protein
MKNKNKDLDPIRRSGTITDQSKFPCSACGAESVHVRSLDRQVHTDGSDNRRCWLAITCEDVAVNYVYVPSRPRDY